MHLSDNSLYEVNSIFRTREVIQKIEHGSKCVWGIL